jgi:hypothetical protein
VATGSAVTEASPGKFQDYFASLASGATPPALYAMRE